MHGITSGLYGFAGGVAAGVSGIVLAPVQGYTDGSGVLAGKQSYMQHHSGWTCCIVVCCNAYAALAVKELSECVLLKRNT